MKDVTNDQNQFWLSGITEYTASNIPLVSEIDLPDGNKYTFVTNQLQASAATLQVVWHQLLCRLAGRSLIPMWVAATK